MAGKEILAIRNLSAGYGELRIVNSVDLTVHEGAIVTVVGPNGAGKSTLQKAVYGLVNVMGGSIQWMGDGGSTELVGLPPHRVTALGINYVPQLNNVFPSMTVWENLEIGCYLTPSNFHRRVEEVIELFPVLSDRRRQMAGTLSGGEAQMLAVGRAMMTSPGLLLLDEPTAGMAPQAVDQLFDKLIEINQLGVSLLIVEQNARRSLAISDYGYVLESGQNRFEGAGEELLADPQVAELYLGGTV